MVNPGLTTEQVIQAAKSFVEHGSITAAAASLNLHRSTFQNRLQQARMQGYLTPDNFLASPSPFEAAPLPTEIRSAEEIKEARRKEYKRKKASRDARKLIDVKIKLDGPIGILHMGDPHIDDPGADIETLERHCAIINETEGLFGGNVGDSHNNWIGRLGHLYGEQEVTKAEAWVLVEDFIGSVDWLYLVGGNHDVWSGAGDPLLWITRNQSGVYENHGARLALKFPNGAEVRVHTRHDFQGHSMWNTAHGVSKAAQVGWRDQILICGHKHTTGYNILKDPASGLVSHAIRVAGYKIYDRYAEQLGLPDHNVSPAVITIIDPDLPDHHEGQVTVFHDVERGAEFLRMLRGQ